MNQAIYTGHFMKTNRLIKDRSAKVLGLADVRQALLSFECD
ncbi:MAG: hypothetical protein R6V73_07825 [Anaerolineales bacterium]